MRGYSRLLAVSEVGCSASSSATICPIPKLIVRVRFPSPAPDPESAAQMPYSSCPASPRESPDCGSRARSARGTLRARRLQLLPGHPVERRGELLFPLLTGVEVDPRSARPISLTAGGREGAALGGAMSAGTAAVRPPGTARSGTPRYRSTASTGRVFVSWHGTLLRHRPTAATPAETGPPIRSPGNTRPACPTGTGYATRQRPGKMSLRPSPMARPACKRKVQESWPGSDPGMAR